MDSQLINQIISGAPNFIGFLLALLILWQAYKSLLDIHKRTIEAIIKSENCEEKQS